ncbi:MAG: hypothetical protein PW734_07810 [Verrucomicrobium sp.]|nr:hypothetical protein [Verrucomicrobium sp.]
MESPQKPVLQKAAEFLARYQILEGLEEVIAYRELLGEVLNANGLLGEGAEIGVKRAVREFAQGQGYKILTTGVFGRNEELELPSWFIIKKRA